MQQHVSNSVTPLTATHTPEQMARVADNYAYKKATSKTLKTISLAISAGIFIGLAFVFYITVTTGSAGTLGWGFNRLIGGIAFSLGLVLLVVCGGELFTSSVLSVIPRANGKINTKQMLANWGKVYLGNFLGAMLLVGIVSIARLYQLDHGAWGLNALAIAHHKLQHSFFQAVMLGVLCNLLVCLAVWMSYSATSTGVKAGLVILPVAMFVSTGCEHIVANMFMVPLGIAIKTWAEPEFWTQVGINASHFADLNWSTFFTQNVIPVTIGNIIGGAVIVGLGYWSIYQRKESKTIAIATPTEKTETTFSFSTPTGETMMNKLSELTIADVMRPANNVVTPEASLADASQLMINEQQSDVVVVDEEMSVKGVISEVEVLKSLWLEDYQKSGFTTVKSAMQKEVKTVALNDSLVKLAEYMSVDLSQVYPVSDSGMLLNATNASLEERLRTSSVYRPKVYPVVENGKLVGVITRHDVLAALQPALGKAKAEQKPAESDGQAQVLDVA